STRISHRCAARHRHHNAMSRASADRKLAQAGTSSCAKAVIGVATSADHRRVAQAARILPSGAAGADCNSDIAVNILGHNVDRAASLFGVDCQLHCVEQVTAEDRAKALHFGGVKLALNALTPNSFGFGG